MHSMQFTNYLLLCSLLLRGTIAQSKDITDFFAAAKKLQEGPGQSMNAPQTERGMCLPDFKRNSSEVWQSFDDSCGAVYKKHGDLSNNNPKGMMDGFRPEILGPTLELWVRKMCWLFMDGEYRRARAGCQKAVCKDDEMRLKREVEIDNDSYRQYDEECPVLLDGYKEVLEKGTTITGAAQSTTMISPRDVGTAFDFTTSFPKTAVDGPRNTESSGPEETGTNGKSPASRNTGVSLVAVFLCGLLSILVIGL